jgi:phage-related minor tail protein
MFKFAKGTGLMGEAGPEAIMPLRRGSDGSLGVVAAGASSPSNVQVVVNNNSNSNATTQESVDSRGNRRIEVTIGDMVAAEVHRKGSAMNSAIASNMGSRNQIVRR